MFVSPAVRRQQLIAEIAERKRAIRREREKLQWAYRLLQRLNQQLDEPPSGVEEAGVLHGQPTRT